MRPAPVRELRRDRERRKKCTAFFDKLVRRGFTAASHCVHNRARLYHVHHKALYDAIGESSSRYRRPVPARRAAERLMLLDAVLTTPDLRVAHDGVEKSVYLASLRASAPADTSPDGPTSHASDTACELSGAFPIGVDSGGRTVLLYLATEPWTDGFRRFLQGHAVLLRVAPTWTLRLVFPRPLDRFYDAYQQVIRDELESPLHPATVNELRWYFEHRRKAAEGPFHPQDKGLLDVAAKGFSAPRFALLYRRWLQHGDVVFDGISSPAIADALKAGTGSVESIVLPHVHRHLAPLVNHDRETLIGVEKGARRGATGLHALNPLPQPARRSAARRASCDSESAGSQAA